MIFKALGLEIRGEKEKGKKEETVLLGAEMAALTGERIYFD